MVTDKEQLVLGTILKTPDLLTQVTSLIDETTFSDGVHRHIWNAMLACYFDQAQPDIVNVYERCKGQGVLVSYIAQLAEGGGYDLKSYAKQLIGIRRNERLANICERILCDVKSGKSHTDIISEYQGDIFTLEHLDRKGGAAPISEIVRDALPGIVDYHENKTGVTTGFSSLDSILHSMEAGNLILLAGRPSHGKTSLAMNMAEEIARSKPVAFFSMEMTRRELAERLIAKASGVPTERWRSGKLGDVDVQKITIAANNVATLKLYIDDTSALSSSDFYARARAMKQLYGIEAIFVDYIGQMREKGMRGMRNDEIGLISAALKMTAKELQLPVIALSQLSRQLEYTRGKSDLPRDPVLADLRDSGNLEQDADIVVFVVRPDQYLHDDDTLSDRAKKEADKWKGKGKLIVAKHRNGRTGMVELGWRGEFTSFVDIDRHHEEPPLL